jgi:hypothetical protein
LIATQKRKIGFAGFVVGAVAKNLNNNVGGSKYGVAIRKNFRALLGIGQIGVSCAFARARLNYHFQPGLRKRWNHSGD